MTGPSQEFGWVGNGIHTPVGVPNIFKHAGIDTRWNPDIDNIFEAGEQDAL